MFRIYERARSEANYNATRFLHMLYEHRGLETARILLHSRNVSEGYAALWERGRFDVGMYVCMECRTLDFQCSRIRSTW